MGARASGRQDRVPRAGSPRRRNSWNGHRATAQAGAERGRPRAAAAVSGRRGSGDWRPAEAEPSVPRAPEGEKKRHQQSGATPPGAEAPRSQAARDASKRETGGNGSVPSVAGVADGVWASRAAG
ncbi:unnamed protein product [Rangifer tarandus platyrhynchus]|uniref:Uncharacterized protein n=2 Tax=Rangifer tarandus platyrhynchus TaxID=3082113 RepID=A0ACB0EP46_RANTA|nr:unnamed protein product [Rangifer tarandus platyrhynchus]CAI9702416.1 unnamed protein product [Rangifer tarandus platyrhynchus]